VWKQHPTLYTLDKGSTVRHLLIEGDNAGAKTLSKLENGFRTVVATGTHYEMDQQALALIQEWCQKEGFGWRSDDAPVWESLREIVALAKLMGHTSVRDVRYITAPGVPLDHWQGCKDKNGDDYQYAYTKLRLVRYASRGYRRDDKEHPPSPSPVDNRGRTTKSILRQKPRPLMNDSIRVRNLRK